MQHFFVCYFGSRIYKNIFVLDAWIVILMSQEIDTMTKRRWPPSRFGTGPRAHVAAHYESV